MRNSFFFHLSPYMQQHNRTYLYNWLTCIQNIFSRSLNTSFLNSLQAQIMVIYKMQGILHKMSLHLATRTDMRVTLEITARK
jgi:hypothetical protein